MMVKIGLIAFLLICISLFLSCGGKKPDNTAAPPPVQSNAPTVSQESSPVTVSVNEKPAANAVQGLVFPQKVDFSQYNSSISRGRLYGIPDARIWGWSKDGKIAYSIETGVDGRGGQIITFVILDLITDKKAFELKMDSFDHNETENEDLYNIYKNDILSAIKANGIVQERAVFSPFPFMANNTEYGAYIADAKYKEDEYGFFDRIVTEYKVAVTANRKNKIISTFTPLRSVTGDVYVCGYVLSPFENRILVVIAEEAWVHEGSELFYMFAGCHLGVGFN